MILILIKVYWLPRSNPGLIASNISKYTVYIFPTIRKKEISVVQTQVVQKIIHQVVYGRQRRQQLPLYSRCHCLPPARSYAEVPDTTPHI